jgi:hypothetical protein
MAFYIEINKIAEEDYYLTYSYEFYITVDYNKNKAGKLRGKSKLVKGELQINKKSGDIKVIKLAEGENGMYIQRATLALTKHWEKGELPDRICWAS